MQKKLMNVVVLIVVLISCSKSVTNNSGNDNDDPGPLAEQSSMNGYGASAKPFDAVSWNLPANVELQDSIHEYSYCWAFDPYTQVPEKDWKGAPIGFPFCITLKNKTSKPVIIQFPPELIFVSASVLHQNTIVIDPGTIEIPASGETTIVAQGFCLNKGRSIPETFVDGTENFLSYSLGPSQIPSALKEVTSIVESKHITMANVLDENGHVDNSKMEKYSVIQLAIWEVTDEGGLSEATRKKLEAL